MSRPTLVLLTDGHEGTALVACPDDDTVERIAFASPHVGAWRIPLAALTDPEAVLRALADSGTCADVLDEGSPSRPVSELLGSGEPARVEMVIYRDPDFANETHTCVNGLPADDAVETYNIDPGAGWELAREEALAEASSDAVRDALNDAYDAGARSEYVEDIG